MTTLILFLRTSADAIEILRLVEISADSREVKFTSGAKINPMDDWNGIIDGINSGGVKAAVLAR